MTAAGTNTTGTEMTPEERAAEIRWLIEQRAGIEAGTIRRPRPVPAVIGTEAEREDARSRIIVRDWRNTPPLDIAHLSIACIYAITCTKTADLYIGRALSLIERIGAHHTAMRHGKCDCRALQVMHDQHGWDALRFHVVEECDYCIQVERERYWIETLCPSLNRCYAVGERRRRAEGKAR